MSHTVRISGGPATGGPESASEPPGPSTVVTADPSLSAGKGFTKKLALDRPGGAEELLGVTLGGRYLVESVLGQGGMGTVYRARHTLIDRPFAVKVLRREIVVDADSVRRFLQEAKIAGGIRHDNLIQVIDFGEVTSVELPSLKNLKQPYLVMELLEGDTLAEMIARDGTVDPARLAEIVAQVAEGLATAHDREVVHRDLKPDNVFLVRGAPGAISVKVLDFGVAKLLSGAALTRKGTVFGTPYYMSPEQASGQKIDGRTDQYALGVVMYEALSGRVPFDADSHMGVMTKHLFATPDPIEAVVPDPSRLGALAPVVMRCLEKRPEVRYWSMRDLGRELRSALKALEGGGAPNGARSSSEVTVAADAARTVEQLKLVETAPPALDFPKTFPTPSGLATAPTEMALRTPAGTQAIAAVDGGARAAQPAEGASVARSSVESGPLSVRDREPRATGWVLAIAGALLIAAIVLGALTLSRKPADPARLASNTAALEGERNAAPAPPPEETTASGATGAAPVVATAEPVATPTTSVAAPSPHPPPDPLSSAPRSAAPPGTAVASGLRPIPRPVATSPSAPRVSTAAKTTQVDKGVW